MNVPPHFFEKPIDLSYEVGTTGHELKWTIVDVSTFAPTYTISKDGIPIESGSLSSGLSEISIDIDGLAVGIYSYSIEYDDGRGATNMDVASVTVSNTAPAFTATPIDVSYEIGSDGNQLSWTFSDISTNNPTYTITRDGVNVLSDIACASGVDIDVSADGLTSGTYIFNIEIDDGYGETITDVAQVTVSNTAPNFTSTPADLTYEEGDTGSKITWIFSDNSTDCPTYTITREGVAIISNYQCSSGVSITISVDGLSEGIYVYAIEVNDGYGSTISDIALITVNATSSEPLQDLPSIIRNFFNENSMIIIPSIIGVFILIAAIIISRSIRKRPVSTPPTTTEKKPEPKKSEKIKPKKQQNADNRAPEKEGKKKNNK